MAHQNSRALQHPDFIQIFSPPRQWPDLYASSSHQINTYEVMEYGTAFFFAMFVGFSNVPTYAAINSGFDKDKPLVIPQGYYGVRVGIYSRYSHFDQPGDPIQSPMRTFFYTENDNINFLSDPQDWDVFLTHEGAYRSSRYSRRFRFSSPSITPKNNADLECILTIPSGLTHGKLKANIWSRIQHRDMDLPPQIELTDVPVELDFWVLGV